MTSQPVFKGFGAPSDGLSFPSVDLSGKLIIKAQLDDDIRRIPIHNEEITCDELLLMMQRVFSGRLSPRDDVVLKYKDEDGDLITISDNADLTLAKQASRVLRIVILVNGQVKPYTHLDPDSVSNVRKELVLIRDCVNGLLDQLDGIHVSTPVTVETKKQEEPSPSAPTVPAPETKGRDFDAAAFDPLKSDPKSSTPLTTETSSLPPSEPSVSALPPEPSQSTAPPQVYQQQQFPSVASAGTPPQPYQQQALQTGSQQQIQAPLASSPGTSYSALGASTQQQPQPGYSNPSQAPYSTQDRSTPTQQAQYPASTYSGYQAQAPQQLQAQAQAPQQLQPTQTYQPGASYSAQPYPGYPQQAAASNPYSRQGQQQQRPQRPQGGYNAYGQQF